MRSSLPNRSGQVNSDLSVGIYFQTFQSSPDEYFLFQKNILTEPCKNNYLKIVRVVYKIHKEERA